MILARFEAVVGQEPVEGGWEGADIEDGLDGAGIGAGPDGLAVGPLAEEQVEGAEDDGFAGTGFAGDNHEAGGDLEGEFGNEGEVADAQGGQHVNDRAPVCARRARGAQENLDRSHRCRYLETA